MIAVWSDTHQFDGEGRPRTIVDQQPVQQQCATRPECHGAAAQLRCRKQLLIRDRLQQLFAMAKRRDADLLEIIAG
jgi:hypothetical protein